MDEVLRKHKGKGNKFCLEEREGDQGRGQRRNDVELALKPEQKFTRGQRKMAFPAKGREQRFKDSRIHGLVWNGLRRVRVARESCKGRWMPFVQGLQCHGEEYKQYLIGNTSSWEGFSARERQEEIFVSEKLLP